MSFASKQTGSISTLANEIGFNYITTSGSTIPVAPTALVSGNTYVIARTPLPIGYYMILVQLDITGDATTAFEAIQVELVNATGTILYDNWLVGATLASTTQIELSGTYPVSISPTNGAGDISVRFIPTFTGTAPTAQGLIRPFKIV
jgi:hypothetical protein